MKKILTLAIIILIIDVIVGTTNAQIAIRSDHPRIWITNDNIAEIRQRNLNGSMKIYWQTYETRKLSGSVNAYNVKDFALGYLITGNQEYALKAIEFLKTGDLGSFRIEWNIIAYDWLYNAMSDSDKEIIMQRLIDWDNNPPPDNPEDCIGNDFVNWNWHHTRLAGIAFWGDHPAAEKALACAEAWWGDCLKIMENIFPDGEWWEGFGYLRHTIPYAVMQMEAIKTATGIDRFKNSEAFKNHPYFIMYAIRPDNTSSRLDDIWHPEPAGQFRSTLLILHHEYQDPYVQWYLNHWAPLSHPNATSLWDIIWYNPQAPEKDPRDLPLAKHFRGWGTVFMRTGWDKGSYENPADNVWLSFHCGDFYSYHNHYDSNSFTVFYQGNLAIDSGGYGSGGTDHNYVTRTIAHNTIIVYDPNEDFVVPEVPNDGGQMILQYVSGRPYRYNDWVNNHEKWESGNINHFITTQDYDYIQGDATKAYNPNKLDLFVREFVFLRPNYVVIFDRVNSTNPDFQKSWLLHSLKKPSLNSNETQSEGTSEGGIWESLNTDLITIDRGDGLNGRLFCKIFLPENHRVRKIGGTGYDFWVDGQNYPQPERKSISEVGVNGWRIEIQPTVPQKEDIFFHVLYVTDTSASQMPPVEKKTSTVGNKMYGAFIDDENYAYLTMFAKGSDEATHFIYEINSTKIVKHLLCGLPANEPFKIYKNGMHLLTGTTSDAGTIFFQGNPGGLGRYEVFVGQNDVNHSEENGTLPQTFCLKQNYPNPFNDSTIITYAIPPLTSDFQGLNTIRVALRVYNLTGQLVKTITDRQQKPGVYRVVWDGRDESGRKVTNGLYLYKLEIGNFVLMKKLILLR